MKRWSGVVTMVGGLMMFAGIVSESAGSTLGGFGAGIVVALGFERFLSTFRSEPVEGNQVEGN